MFEQLKATKSYQHLNSIFSACMGILVIGLLFLFVGIASLERGLIAITLVINLILSVIIYISHKDMTFIKKEAKSFQRCEGLCVNVSGEQAYRGYTALLIEFEDYIGNQHRMPTHAIFHFHEVALHIEKEVIVYYSPKYKVVLIENVKVTFPDNIEQEEDPFK